MLRPWREADIAPFHAMGQDKEVMRHLGPAFSRREAKAAYRGMVACQRSHGYCFWVVELKRTGKFIGFCGLKPGGHPINGIEISWRFKSAHWGQGLAREAAEASLAWAWGHLDVAAITAVTTPGNTRSWGLMERLGMKRFSDLDFDHPELDPGDPLRPHILYRISRLVDA